MQDEQIIDNVDLKSLQPDMSFVNGFNFPKNNRTTALIISVFVVIGFFIAINNLNIVGILFFGLLLFPLFYVLFSKNGTDLSTKQNYYKEFSSFFGIKSGKWKTAYGLTDVSILTLNKSHVIGNIIAPSVKISEAETGVYLLTPSHRKRKLVCVCVSLEQADKLAKDIAFKMNKNYKKFNPQISEHTKMRRRR